MISEEEVEKAAAFIRDNAREHAKAKANRIYLHEFRKSKKALLINQAPKGTAQAMESFAYGHPEYLEVLQGYKIAIEEEERIIWTIRAAQAKIEIWRSQQANNRKVDSAHN